VSIGDTLGAARRQAGLTITQVSQRTCIRETIVRGIERGDYSACGGDFYARGHIRSIARAVGLDPDELIREYDATEAQPEPITAAEVFQPVTPVKLKEKRRANWSIVLLAGVIAVAAIVGFKYFTSHSPKPRSAGTASHSTTTPPPSRSPGITQPVSQTRTHIKVTLVALAGNVTWAQATTAGGKVLWAGDLSSGSRKTWIVKHPLTVRLGNPGGARLYLNGKHQRFAETTQPITMLCTLKRCS